MFRNVMFNPVRKTMEGRMAERVRTRATGSCTSPRGFEWEIAYEDLSHGGCRVDDPRHGLELGQIVKLDIAGTGPHHAEVAWRQGDRVGLEFMKPMSDVVFRHLVNEEWDAAREADRTESTRLPVRRLI